MKLRFTGLMLLVLGVLLLPGMTFAQDVETSLVAESSEVEVTSGERVYPSYLSAPTEGGPFPAIILIHSFRGLEEGYKTMVDQLAAKGFVVLALGWQTFEQDPGDTIMQQLVTDSIAFLSARDDVDPERIGLTGFCAGGRYTMLLLPQVEGLKAGVAWYGFPNNGSPSASDLVGDLEAPMLIIHGTADDPSPIAGIYQYATDLQNAGAYFEMKVYYGEPHGFMLSGGQLREDEIAVDAFNQMADFFARKLA